MIPLLLSLEWAEAHPDAAREMHDGLELVRALVSEIAQPAG
jgi:hypothetical protein